MPFEPGKIPEGAKPFQPGESGNKNGRPKKLPALDVLMERVMGEEKDGITAMEAIIMKLRQQAAAGNIKAADILLDRTFGKAKQGHEIALLGPDGNTLQPSININIIQKKEENG